MLLLFCLGFGGEAPNSKWMRRRRSFFVDFGVAMIFYPQAPFLFLKTIFNSSYWVY
jgi:hypothetical protein